MDADEKKFYSNWLRNSSAVAVFGNDDLDDETIVHLGIRNTEFSFTYDSKHNNPPKMGEQDSSATHIRDMMEMISTTLYNHNFRMSGMYVDDTSDMPKITYKYKPIVPESTPFVFIETNGDPTINEQIRVVISMIFEVAKSFHLDIDDLED